MPSEKKMLSAQVTEAPQSMDDENVVLEIDIVELMYRMIEEIKWIVLAAVVGMTLAGLITLFLIPAKYEATTKLYVQEAKDKIVDLSAINLSDKLAADYLQVFNNWHVHDDVIKALNLPYDYEEIQRMLNIDILPNTRILSITVTSTNPQEAYNIARAYAVYAPSFIEKTMLTSRPTIFEAARVPTMPSSPSMILNLLLGTVMGAAVAMGIIFAQFMSDDRIRNAEMLQKRIGLATLGMMPVQEGASNNSKRIGRGAKT